MQHISRRQFLKLGAGVALAAALPWKSAWAALPPRNLAFYHLHTGEQLHIVYAEGGQYIPEALAEINHLLRDFRTGEVHVVDARLLDQLYLLQQRVETPGAFHVISGYRSPQTNRMLHAHSGGVANKSLHMEGRAIDICLPGKELASLHRAALALQAGGVGYYPASNFIHMDTGRIRRWG